MPFNGAKPKSQLVILFLLPGLLFYILLYLYFFSFFNYVLNYIPFSFVPPEKFNLAVLTLELEFVKKGNRSEEVSLPSHSFALFFSFFISFIDFVMKLCY
jgi:hypothetical protein